jgi:hypothetical protein
MKTKDKVKKSRSRGVKQLRSQEIEDGLTARHSALENMKEQTGNVIENKRQGQKVERPGALLTPRLPDSQLLDSGLSTVGCGLLDSSTSQLLDSGLSIFDCRLWTSRLPQFSEVHP